ncbi:MAG: RNA pyrophosphohydrolase [Hyphomicrobiaceae bacterium]|nr:RNA pyrophosphohydrolase [Hyphomicrobiaceae bacterium]
MPVRETMPYRPCAGIALFNRDGLVFMGKRLKFVEGELANPWQMPQGGLDKGEDPATGGLRELAEETNVTNVNLLRITDDWLTYELPDAALGVALKGKYRGQKQKWLAALLTGGDDEIDVENPMMGAHPAEFSAWEWVPLEETLVRVVPFKREVYDEVVRQFADLPARIRAGEFA